MEQLTNHRLLPSSLQTLYAPVADHLAEVDQVLLAELTSGDAFIDQLIRHGFQLGGKRLRPALVLLTGAAVGRLRSDHVRLAAAVELIHVATLVHDDVLDEATLRRHLETVNARWDNEASVLLGDYLLARSICLAASVEGGGACREIGEASRLMCEGELRQMNSRGNYELDEAEYMDIIGAKTAALIATCARLGATSAGADPAVVERLARYGENLGIAFQITDDLLDLIGDESTAGKSLGTDIVKQKPTLPLIHVFQQADSDERAEVLQLLSREGNHHADALRPWFERFESVEYARRVAGQFAEAAALEVEGLAPNAATAALEGLAAFVMERQT